MSSGRCLDSEVLYSESRLGKRSPFLDNLDLIDLHNQPYLMQAPTHDLQYPLPCVSETTRLSCISRAKS